MTVRDLAKVCDNFYIEKEYSNLLYQCKKEAITDITNLKLFQFTGNKINAELENTILDSKIVRVKGCKDGLFARIN